MVSKTNKPTGICALLAAAGAGQRFSANPAELPKAFQSLQGKPLLSYSLELLRACEEIESIIIIVSASLEASARNIIESGKSNKPETVISGGKTRQESVYRGLLVAPPNTEYVLIHDAARPFLTAEMVRESLHSAQTHGAAILALPATETVKLSLDGAWVNDTLDRSQVWLVQTPQAFAYKLLLEAHEQALRTGFQASDDAGLVENLGHRVHLVKGSADNIKITYKEDLAMAEQIAAARFPESAPSIRIGLGFDSHAFAAGRKLILAGMEFPGPGLAGHSDADLICHAAADALLGAAGLGDIGTHFPDTDPQYAGASSLQLLGQVGELLPPAGFRISWMDIVLAAQAPSIAAHGPQMRENLARVLKLSPNCISLKGKTTNGLGFVGRSEGMACWAICLLISAA
jgi:2-C-methyl-D-erythritol 4-phosphate cytidylyltransferase/2-C-methyl-D-erythritol 2,4-cyclodiphosphate synthase